MSVAAGSRGQLHNLRRMAAFAHLYYIALFNNVVYLSGLALASSMMKNLGRLFFRFLSEYLL